MKLKESATLLGYSSQRQGLEWQGVRKGEGSPDSAQYPECEGLYPQQHALEACGGILILFSIALTAQLAFHTRFLLHQQKIGVPISSCLILRGGSFTLFCMQSTPGDRCPCSGTAQRGD